MNDSAREKVIKIAEAEASAGDGSYILALRGATKGILESKEISGKVAGNAVATEQLSRLS